MDAADRRELDELRRRAYGPDPDIGGDPAALARLAALEDLARPAPPPLPPPPPAGADAGRATAATAARVRPDDPPGGTVPGPSPEEPVPEAPSGPAPRRTSRRRTALIAGAGVAVLLVVVAAIQIGLQLSDRAVAAAPAPTPVTAGSAYRFISDPGSRIVARASVEGFVPTGGQDERSIEVGDYFGWKLSILNTSDASSCIVLTRTTTYRNCVSDSVLSTGGMMVALPYAAVPKAERPVGMRKNQSIGYWLLPDGRVMLVLGPTEVLTG
jgi:hypothetical protein